MTLERDELRAHLIEAVFGLSVFDIRDQDESWVCQVRFPPAPGTVVVLGERGERLHQDLPIGATWKEWRDWLKEHRCHCSL
jgi:hypothetical protein